MPGDKGPLRACPYCAKAFRRDALHDHCRRRHRDRALANLDVMKLCSRIRQTKHPWRKRALRLALGKAVLAHVRARGARREAQP